MRGTFWAFKSKESGKIMDVLESMTEMPLLYATRAEAREDKYAHQSIVKVNVTVKEVA